MTRRDLFKRILGCAIAPAIFARLAPRKSYKFIAADQNRLLGPLGSSVEHGYITLRADGHCTFTRWHRRLTDAEIAEQYRASSDDCTRIRATFTQAALDGLESRP